MIYFNVSLIIFFFSFIYTHWTYQTEYLKWIREAHFWGLSSPCGVILHSTSFHLQSTIFILLLPPSFYFIPLSIYHLHSTSFQLQSTSYILPSSTFHLHSSFYLHAFLLLCHYSRLFSFGFLRVSTKDSLAVARSNKY